MIDTVALTYIAGAATCGASALSAYCLVRWRRAEVMAARWQDAAQAYAALVGRARVPALTVVAPLYHAPFDSARTQVSRAWP